MCGVNIKVTPPTRLACCENQVLPSFSEETELHVDNCFLSFTALKLTPPPLSYSYLDPT